MPLPNPVRGEVEAEVGGRQIRLCVTLGALAMLEGHFRVSGFDALAERLRTVGAEDVPVVFQALALDPGVECGMVSLEAVEAIVAAFEAMND